MKYILTFSILIFSTVLSAQILWQNTYDLTESYSVIPMDMVIQNDQIVVGGFYLSGSSSSSRTNFVLSVDPLTGDSITLDNCQSGVFCDNRNDILLMAGNENDEIFTAGNLDLGDSDYLAKINNSGDITLDWIRDNFHWDNIHHINHLEVVEDGMIIAGSFSNIDYFMKKISFTGETVWSRRFPITPVGFGSRLAILPNGSIAFLVKSNINDISSHLSLINGNGGITFSIQPDMDIFELAFNSFNEIITLERETVFDENFSVVKYDMSGDATIVGEYPLDDSRNLLLNSQNEIYIIETTTENEIEGFRVHKLSPNGDFLWTNFYGEAGIEYTHRSSKLLNDNTLIIMGNSISDTFNNNEVLLMAIDLTSLPASTMVENINQSFIFYPNPAKESVQLQISSNAIQRPTSYALFGTDGKLIQTDNFTNSIQLKDLSSGLFIVKLFGENGNLIGVKKILKK